MVPRPFSSSLSVLLAAAAAALAFVTPAAALEECRLMRMPDVQGDRIVFVRSEEHTSELQSR